MAPKDKNKVAAESTEIEKVAAPGAMQVFDYGEDVGAGFERQTDKDQSLPIMNVLQSNSPAVQENKIDGARAGMIVNTATSKLYESIPGKPGVLVIPACSDRVFLRYRKRTLGGGFRGKHQPNDPIVLAAQEEAERTGAKFGKLSVFGNSEEELSETFELYCILVDPEEGLMPAVFGFQSTKIKHYKNWNTRIRQCTVQQPNGRKVAPPYFAHPTIISTWLDKNSEGTFYNVAFRAAVDNDIKKSLMGPDDERYQAAKALKEFVLSGGAKVAYEKADGTAGSDDAGESAAPF